MTRNVGREIELLKKACEIIEEDRGVLPQELLAWRENERAIELKRLQGRRSELSLTLHCVSTKRIQELRRENILKEDIEKLDQRIAELSS